MRAARISYCYYPYQLPVQNLIVLCTPGITDKGEKGSDEHFYDIDVHLTQLPNFSWVFKL